MSHKSNFAHASLTACALFLLLSSTAWAENVSVHDPVPAVHIKASSPGNAAYSVADGKPPAGTTAGEKGAAKGGTKAPPPGSANPYKINEGGNGTKPKGAGISVGH